MAVIEFINVKRSYPTGITAIEDFSARLSVNEFVVVLGGVGAGKTVLANLIAGLELPQEGKILLDGNELLEDVSLRNAAMMFQHYGLRPDLTVYQNLALGLRLRGTAKAEIDKRVQAAAKQLGFAELLQKKPRKLSRLMQKKVQLARVLVRDVDIFLLDEPCGGLNDDEKRALMDEIKKVHSERSIPFVYATRNEDEARHFDCRVLLLNRGKLMGFDRIGALYDDPPNPFAAAFLGNPPMNLVASKLLPSWTGEAGLIGFRPQAVQLFDSAVAPSQDHLTLTAVVLTVESVENQKLYHLKIDGRPSPILALASCNIVMEAGSPVGLAVNREDVKLFLQEGSI